MIQSKVFLGSLNNPVDKQFNEWMEENHNHIKITNYDFKLARCSDHALCIIYNDFNKISGKDGKDPFTDEPVIEPRKYGEEFSNLIKEFYTSKRDGKLSDPHEVNELSKKIHDVCPYSTSYEQPGSYPSGSICESKKCITCGCSTFESMLMSVREAYENFDKLIREWCVETKFGAVPYKGKNQNDELIEAINLACPNRNENKMLCTGNSCRVGCSYFRDACIRAGNEYNKSP